jgi:molecular chaperone GrpE
VVTKEQQTTKPQEKEKVVEEGQAEVSSGHQDQAPIEEATVDKESEFDPETAEREALISRYLELKDQLSEAEEKVLRTAADAENFKKRLQREKEDQTRYANEAFMRDLLSVLDNLERALQHSESTSNQEGLAEGLSMTLKGFVETLARFGCTPVEAVGEAFDPNFHEAVSQEESLNDEPNTVLRELQKGYMLKDRLLRPAMVIVSKPASQIDRETGDQDQAETEKANKGEVKIKIKKV